MKPSNVKTVEEDTAGVGLGITYFYGRASKRIGEVQQCMDASGEVPEIYRIRLVKTEPSKMLFTLCHEFHHVLDMTNGIRNRTGEFRAPDDPIETAIDARAKRDLEEFRKSEAA